MNIIKQITQWHKFELPPIKPKHSISLATAYACMDCRTVQDGAAHGHCYTCGSGNVRSIDDAFDWISNEIHQRLEAAKVARSFAPSPSNEVKGTSPYGRISRRSSPSSH